MRSISLTLVALFLGCGSVVAQLRIIPQARLDSVLNPQTVVAAPIEVSHDGALDMGTMDEDATPWMGQISWQNRGDEPLVVTRVATTCGCLRAEFEPRPLQRNESQTIQITYHPKGHPGTVYQRLFVYTNLSANRPTFVVRVQGIVTPSQQGATRYPYARGPLLMRADEVRFAADETEVRIACKNNGPKALTLRADSLLSPDVVMESEPRCLEAGQEGDLVFRRTLPTRTRVVVLRGADGVRYGRPLRVVISE